MLLKNKYSFYNFLFLSCIYFSGLLGFVIPLRINAQTNISSHAKKSITAEFFFHQVEYTEMAVISNVLKVKNNVGKNYSFTVQLTLPNKWRTLNNAAKEYTLAPNDSVFIPIRLITSNKAAKGGTKYNITAFISSSDGIQMAAAGFLAGRPKTSNWQLNILPRTRIYFLNNENGANFKVNLTNDGDEDQGVILSMNKVGRDFIVTDTAGKMLKKNYIELKLPPLSDTIIPFSILVQPPQRNEKRIDTYGYIPGADRQEKRFGLFIKASETGVKPGTSNAKSNKVDFVKLANNIDFVKLNNVTRVNQYGSSIIPLTMEANISNILGIQPMMNLMFYGNTQLDQKSRLDYNLQTGFSYYKYSNRIFSGASGILGYYHEKGFVTIGNGVSLNMPNVSGFANGRGIAGGYYLTKTQSVGAYFVRNGQNFLNYSSTSFGTGYSAQFNKLQVGLTLGRINMFAGGYSNSVNTILNYNINRYQNIGVGGGYFFGNSGGISNNRRLFNLNYNATYLKSKANSGLSFTYQEGFNGFGPGLVASSNYKNINFGLVNSYQFNKGFGLGLQNSYGLFQLPMYVNNVSTLKNNIVFNNFLNFHLPHGSKISYIPTIYCHYSDYFTEKMLSGGVQLGINSFNQEENFRLGIFLKGGYNKILNFPELGTFFTAQSSLFLSYRTWIMNLRYAYGPQGQGNMVYTLSTLSEYPQIFFANVSNQYQFKNRHFILENSLGYNYVNISRRHNIGLTSNLFFYTIKGWRFNVNGSFNYNVSRSFRYSYSPGATNGYSLEATSKKSRNQSFQLGFGVRKEFGIPIPKRFTKTRNCNANLKIFLDLNGNKKFDPDEIPLENIVVRMNEFEVISNELGEAGFMNITLGKYKLQVIPLVDIGAWFPVITDSIEVCGPPVLYIPFSQGVQILGNVQIDREKFSAEITEKLDISRIKIFLVDTSGHTITSITDNRGNFKFYVPYGKYVLKFDEKILGNDFDLVQNDIPVVLEEGMESYYHTFFIVEKKRRVTNKKFNADGSVTVTKEDAGSSTKEKNAAQPANKKTKTLPKKPLSKTAKDSLQKAKLQKIKASKDSVQRAKFMKDSIQRANSTKDSIRVDSLKKESRKLINKIELENLENEDMTNMHEMDSLVDALLSKPDSSILSDSDVAKVEAWWIKKSHLSNFKDKELYVLQVGAFKGALPVDVLVKFLKTGEKMESFVDSQDGLTKYFIGKYSTYEEATVAKAEMRKKGLPGAFVIAVYKGDIITADELNKIKKGK